MLNEPGMEQVLSKYLFGEQMSEQVCDLHASWNHGNVGLNTEAGILSVPLPSGAPTVVCI